MSCKYSNNCPVKVRQCFRSSGTSDRGFETADAFRSLSLLLDSVKWSHELAKLHFIWLMPWNVQLYSHNVTNYLF